MNIQQEKPKRKFTETRTNYGAYKKYIIKDFNNKCGYCDDLDKFNGGYRNYQIDHFKPKNKFPDLETTYDNLVYCCPFCNRAKWDKWEDKDGFIDPCCDEYDNHISRNDKGQIQYDTTPQGKYIYENLKLHLKRHELLWMIEKLQKQSIGIDNEIVRLGEGHEKELIILREFKKIQNEINKYTNLFHAEI